MKFRTLQAAILIGFVGFGSNAAFADDDDDDAKCPVGLISGLTLDEEFGDGAADVTRCLKKTRKVKTVFNIHRDCRGATDKTCTVNDGTQTGKPYAVGNMRNALKDYEITHGMDRDDYELVGVVYGAGANLILKGNRFEGAIAGLMADGVKFYFCQNTARAKGIQLEDMIEGVEFVTAGVTALADLQSKGYSQITPNF